MSLAGARLICPSVTGAALEHGEFMACTDRGRLPESVARFPRPESREMQSEPAGHSHATARTALGDVQRALSRLFSQLQPQKVERDLSTRPVQTVQNVILNNADGSTPVNSASYRHRDSHIYSSVTEDFASVVVVVNDSETGQATFGQLSDYVGMVALARVDLSADFTGADSILRLFAASDSITPPPARLTESDRSFLKTLYGADISRQRPRKLISTTMIRGLVPE